MSDAWWGLFGIIVGGLIASIVPLISLRMHQHQWAKERRLDHLKEKRQRLEELSVGVSELLPSLTMQSRFDWDSMVGVLALVMRLPSSNAGDLRKYYSVAYQLRALQKQEQRNTDEYDQVLEACKELMSNLVSRLRTAIEDVDKEIASLLQ